MSVYLYRSDASAVPLTPMLNTLINAQTLPALSATPTYFQLLLPSLWTMDTSGSRYYSLVIASDVAINWHDPFDSLVYHTPVPGFGAVTCTGSFSSPDGSASSWTTNS